METVFVAKMFLENKFTASIELQWDSFAYGIYLI